MKELSLESQNKLKGGSDATFVACSASTAIGLAAIALPPLTFAAFGFGLACGFGTIGDLLTE